MKAWNLQTDPGSRIMIMIMVTTKTWLLPWVYPITKLFVYAVNSAREVLA